MAVNKNQLKLKKMNRDQIKKNIDHGKQGVRGETYIKLPEGMEFFKPVYAEGKTLRTYKLNIIPFVCKSYNPEVKEEFRPCLWFRHRYRVGMIGETKVVSPVSLGGSKCPMTELFFKLKDDPTNINEDELKKFGTKTRDIMFVTDVKDPNAAIKVMDFSTFLFGDKLDAEMYSEEYEADGKDVSNFFDLEEGFTIEVQFKKKRHKTTVYSEVSKLTFIDREGDMPDMDTIQDLPEVGSLLKVLSVAEIKKMMQTGEIDDEGMSSDEDEDEEDEVPVKKKVTKKAVVDDDDDEDETSDDDDGDVEEEDEDDEPVKSKRPAKVSTVTRKQKPQEDDEEDTEDEEPIKPLKKKVVTKKPVKKAVEVADDEDEDEDEAPIKKKKKASFKKPVDEDEDDEYSDL